MNFPDYPKPSYMTWNGFVHTTLLDTAKQNQQFCCGVCGDLLTGVADPHHALLTKRDVMGCKKEVKNLIHHHFNILALCRDCHTDITKAKSARALYDLYGQDVVDWYNNFPLKSNKENLFYKEEK